MQPARIIITHSDATTRQSLEQLLRRRISGALFVGHAETPAQAMEQAGSMDPQVVFLDLDQPGLLSLDVARALHRPTRRMIGLYNPLLSIGDTSKMLRDAVRSGISDFLTVPVSESELSDALDNLFVFSDGSTMPEARVVSFFGHKGGCGKTTLALHCALALASSSSEELTLLLDAVAPFGDVAGLIPMDGIHDLSDFVNNLDHLGPLESYSGRDEHTGLHVIGSPEDFVDALRITPEMLGRSIVALRSRFSRIVLDLPVALDLYTATALDLSDCICVVTEPTPVAVRHTAGLLKILDRQGYGAARIRLILNKHKQFSGCLTIEDVAEAVGRAPNVVIPYDMNVAESAADGENMLLYNPRSMFSKTVVEMAGGLFQNETVGRPE